ncbi:MULTISPECIES: PNPOx family protein [Paenibacillus]|uniref:hypothetical protein n=1 Tax=Paenibacillus TaxID=44249 RepID=UPI0022B8F6FA|nr:hypothetical protein [Paenibacillus caseinilyticus]MCZ8518747.1 hypothetical protein [Paenibacillus caseinilyticus]
MAETITALSEPLSAPLHDELFALWGTIDHGFGSSATHTLSGLMAMDQAAVFFAAEERACAAFAMECNHSVEVTRKGPGSAHAVYGRALTVTETPLGVPIPLACFDLDITWVHEALFDGACTCAPPLYEKTYMECAAEEPDTPVFLAMKKA